MSMLTWVFLFLWENRKLLKINKLDLDIIADYLSIKPKIRKQSQWQSQLQ